MRHALPPIDNRLEAFSIRPASTTQSGAVGTGTGYGLRTRYRSFASTSALQLADLIGIDGDAPRN
eukprot:scaffold31173_cov50-Prasinocladus_malaysianus.AAC.1